MYDSSYEIIPPEHDKFMLRIMTFNSLPTFSMHWHGHTELLYFTDGESDIYVNGNEIHTKPGDLVVINANELHRGSVIKGKGHYVCIMLPPSFFDAAGGEMRYIFKNLIRNDSFIGKTALEIEKEHRDTKKRFLVLSMSYALVSYLMENHSYTTMSRREYAQHSRKHEIFNSIIDHIERNYTEPLTTKELAKKAHLSETYFCHLFKSCMNETVSVYITGLRVEHAKFLLANSKMSVTEISSASGYNDVNYFSRIFRRTTGMSPGEFRKKSAE